jgi:hypothetical protein
MCIRRFGCLLLALVCLSVLAPLLAQAPAPAPKAGDVPVERDAAPAPRDEALDRPPVVFHGGARVRVGGDVTVAEGERVSDVVAVFGRIELNGVADGNVVAVFGDVVVGPRGVVRGDVAAIGGRVLGAEGASLWGNLTQVGWTLRDLRFTFGDRNMTTIEVVPDWPRIARIQWWLAFASTGLLALLCTLVFTAAPRVVDAAVDGTRPLLTAWLVGMLVQVFGLPVLAALSVALVATVIGIPLLAAVPVLLLALAAMGVVGVAGLAVRVGLPLLPPSLRGGSSLLAFAAGFVVLASPVLIGSYLWTAGGGSSILALGLILVGGFVEYMWWTVGLGAGVVAWRRNRRSRRRAPTQTPAAPLDPGPPVDPTIEEVPLSPGPLPSGI